MTKLLFGAALVLVAACPGSNSSQPRPAGSASGSATASAPAPTTPTGSAAPGSAAGIAPGSGAATAGSGADVTKPCSMITAAEVGAIIGFAVTAVDEHYRCKFNDSKGGYLQLELMEWTSRSAKEICEYAPAKRTVVTGVGDSASYFGATACVKLGDVAIIVDGPNLADSSDALHKSGGDNPMILIAKKVASRIP